MNSTQKHSSLHQTVEDLKSEEKSQISQTGHSDCQLPPPPPLPNLSNRSPEPTVSLSRTPDSMSPHPLDPKFSNISKSTKNMSNKYITRRQAMMPSPPPPTAAQMVQELSNSSPADFRPGRLSSLDVISRIFPHQKRSVLDLVLQGCNGDVVKAIEHFLSLNDAMFLHHNHSGHNYSAFSDSQQRRREIEANMSPILGSIKSAFTPLNSGIGLSASNPMFASTRTAPLGPPPPPIFPTMFPSSGNSYHRDFGSTPSIAPYPNAAAIHYLFHPNNTFSSGSTNTVCPSGCSQCSVSMATAANVMLQNGADSPSSISVFKEVRGNSGHETAVDLSTEASSWRSSPASSRGSKGND